jgi:hypothetical protein
VSYALELADPAREELVRLDSWLAEETLDEIERLAEQPPAHRTRTGTLVHDFVRIKGQARHYVFIVVFPDEVARVLRVESIGYYVRENEADP